MRDIDREAAVELQQKIRATIGWKVRRELSAVARMYRVFLGNDRELQTFLVAQAEPERALQLWNVENREGFEGFLDETDRLLHNYLASAAALRDHTRRMWQRHPPADATLRDEYARRVDQEFGTPVCVFVQNLRNYALHRRLPVAEGTLDIDVQGDAIDASVQLVREDLLTWDNWPPKAKIFLKDRAKPIRVQEIVAAYSAAVRRFNEWFGPAFVSGHSRALDELAELETERRRLFKTLPDWPGD